MYWVWKPQISLARKMLEGQHAALIDPRIDRQMWRCRCSVQGPLNMELNAAKQHPRSNTLKVWINMGHVWETDQQLKKVRFLS